MGCTNTFVNESQPRVSRELKNSQVVHSSSLFQTPKITNAQSYNRSIPNLVNNHVPHEESEYEYTLKSFHPIEKIMETTIYKQFRVINNHTNTVQMMYVIPSSYVIKSTVLESLMQLKNKNMVNINFLFTDNNFQYIITDFALTNIYEAVYEYSMFTNDKIKKILRTILITINYLYEQNESILRLDYSKIKILNESLDIKIEHFDIKYLIFCSEEINPIENILYELGKIIVILLNNKKELPFMQYDSIDIAEFSTLDELLTDSPIELIDLIEVLLSGQETNIQTILSMPYFSNVINYPSFSNLRENEMFLAFYSKYQFHKAAKKFIKYYPICRENSKSYSMLFDDLGHDTASEIEIKKLTQNLRMKLQDKFTEYEMNEIETRFSHIKLTMFSQEQFIQILNTYDCSLYKNLIKKAFDFLDTKHYGRVNRNELRNIFSQYDKMSEELEDIIKEVSKSKDQMMTFNEFLYILIKIT